MSYVIIFMLAVEKIALFEISIFLKKIHLKLNYYFGYLHYLLRSVNILENNLTYYSMHFHLVKKIKAIYLLWEAFIIEAKIQI